jgi:hypothetical protein
MIYHPACYNIAHLLEEKKKKSTTILLYALPKERASEQGGTRALQSL